MGIAPGVKAISCMTSWDGVPQGCPFVPGKWSRGPHSPQCTPSLPGQTPVHQDSFAPSAVTGRWPAGYSQPGCDFIHCFVSQCQPAVFHIIPGPQLQLGEESSACSTGWGYCYLLFLLAVCLLLPQRSLSPQTLSMLECEFAFCDHSIQTFSPSCLDYLFCVPELLCQYLPQLWDLSIL